MPVWGRVLASVASMAATLLVSVQAAQAATCVGTLTDCDADGIPNDVDPCPGKPGNSGAWHGGFQDVDCWLPLLEFKDAPVAPFDPLCVPVAARPIRDLIPVDATKPSLGTKAVDGVMFVGVYSGSAGVAGALPADVAAGRFCAASILTCVPGNSSASLARLGAASRRPRWRSCASWPTACVSHGGALTSVG